MHVYDPFKSTVTTNASTAIPMERETIEDKTLSFATLVSYTRSVPLRVVCHKHVSYHVVLCQLRRRKLHFRDSECKQHTPVR